MSLTTHVLDTARGRPAAGLRVTVEARAGDGWRAVGGGLTDADGRVPGLVADGALGLTGFYPRVTVVCRIDDPGAHYHVPLLLSPYGYSTYRGS
jgi:5-hydroxyisourate hydrolase